MNIWNDITHTHILTVRCLPRSHRQFYPIMVWIGLVQPDTPIQLSMSICALSDLLGRCPLDIFSIAPKFSVRKILGGCRLVRCRPSRHLYCNTNRKPIENFRWFVCRLGLSLSTFSLYHRYKKYEFFVVVGVEKTIG